MYDSIGIPISPNSCMSTEYRQLKAIVRQKFVTLYSFAINKNASYTIERPTSILKCRYHCTVLLCIIYVGK